jgi:hypothetical protein
VVRGLRARHSSFPRVLEHFSFFAICAFLAAIHSPPSSQFPVPLFFLHSTIPTLRHSIHLASALSLFSPKILLRRAWKKVPIRDHPRFIRG